VGSLARFSEFNTARRGRNQTQLQRLKPIERNFASARLKPGPPKGPENSARGAKKFRIGSTENTEKSHGERRMLGSTLRPVYSPSSRA
jgi:hypothetical protein